MKIKKQLWTFLVLYFINKNQHINDTYVKLRIMLYDQPALSSLAGISFMVLLNTPYKGIICCDSCCMQICGVDCNLT
jgi:hypothetical protein